MRDDRFAGTTLLRQGYGGQVDAKKLEAFKMNTDKKYDEHRSSFAEAMEDKKVKSS